MYKRNQRKYYRFRADRFYGGIATANCMGCNMDCAFCWSFRTRLHPERFGTFYTPEAVAERLVIIAHSHVSITYHNGEGQKSFAPYA